MAAVFVASVAVRSCWRCWSLAVIGRAAARNEPTVDELKARLCGDADRRPPHLCLQIAQKQLAEADKLYAADEIEKARRR